MKIRKNVIDIEDKQWKFSIRVISVPEGKHKMTE